MYPNIIAECARYNLTKQGLADMLSVSPGTVYNWLNGRTEIPSAALKKMALTWDVTIDYLLIETNEKSEDFAKTN